MTDQEALEAFLQSHEWEWQPGDIAYYKDGGSYDGPFIMLAASSKHWWDIFRLTRQVVGATPVNEHLFPWAGSWIEGRLRKMLDEYFYGLLRRMSGTIHQVQYDLFDGTGLRNAEAQTAIQAYLVALEAVLPETKHD